MELKIKKSNKGITLIALVITIIVLVILAGVSIAMLTGENGLLTKAQTASNETKQKGALEKVKLAVAGSWGNDGKINTDELKNNLNNVEGIEKSTIKDSLPMIVKVDGTDVIIESNGRVESNNGSSEETGLPSTEQTKPYLPSDEFSKVDGTDLNTGLVIKDKDGNSYAWVEVPKSIYITATSKEDYQNIEKDMQTYAIDYRQSDYTDAWYDGCGISTEAEYNKLKNTMLKSVYNNGGFWIGQYEVGTEGVCRNFTPTNYNAEHPIDDKPVIKENTYAYNWVRCSQAQQLAQKFNSGNYTSSLMFGIQWDLTMKYIEAKGVKTQAQLKTNSTEWGNYENATFEVTKGEYSTDSARTFNNVTGSYTKNSGNGIAFTTGITNRNSALNIYDLAGGNVWEMILEKGKDSSTICVTRGGYYYTDGGSFPANFRSGAGITFNGMHVGFRTVLF